LRGRIADTGGKVYSLLPLLRQIDKTPVRSTVNAATGELGDVLISPFSEFDYGGDLAFVQPFGRLFSLQASASITREDQTVSPYNLVAHARHDFDVTNTLPEFGLAFAFDAAKLRVPVAFMLEYTLSLPHAHSQLSDTSHSYTQNLLALDVLYTGRSDLQTGVVLFGQWGTDPIQNQSTDGSVLTSGRNTRLGAELTLRYFW
jgi:hypothetical protein